MLDGGGDVGWVLKASPVRRLFASKAVGSTSAGIPLALTCRVLRRRPPSCCLAVGKGRCCEKFCICPKPYSFRTVLSYLKVLIRSRGCRATSRKITCTRPRASHPARPRVGFFTNATRIRDIEAHVCTPQQGPQLHQACGVPRASLLCNPY